MLTKTEWLTQITEWVSTHIDSNSIQTKWIIFSGAPSSGKSTTGSQLRDIYHLPLREETATKEITRLKLDMGDEACFKYLGTFDFSHSMIQKKLADEPTNPREHVIIDSGLIEAYCYFQLIDKTELVGKEIDPLLNERVKQHLSKYKYNLIFSFEMLPLVENGIRIEPDPVRKILHNSFRDAYAQLGCKVIIVPVASCEVRAKFILNEIRKIESVPMPEFGLKTRSGRDRFGLYSTPSLPNNTAPMTLQELKPYSGGLRFWNELVGVCNSSPDTPQSNQYGYPA